MKYTMRRGSNRFRMTEYGREKYCSYCCSWWGVEHFAPHPRGQGRLDNRCHACQKERRTSRTVQALALALLALMLGGCNGYSINNREATWCVAPELYEPAKAAADEWHERSDGEVSFTLDPSKSCEAPLRISVEDLPGEFGGLWSLDREALLVDPAIRHDFESVRVSMLHEWGHYLTGRAHSDDPSDVMYERYGGALHLSDADVARLDWDSRRVTGGYF